MLTDLPEHELRAYRSSQTCPGDFDAFWTRTLAEARAAAASRTAGAHGAAATGADARAASGRLRGLSERVGQLQHVHRAGVAVQLGGQGEPRAAAGAPLRVPGRQVTRRSWRPERTTSRSPSSAPTRSHAAGEERGCAGGAPSSSHRARSASSPRVVVGDWTW